ncbi:hypothetical protein ACSX1A_16635 [Pontibacter sp. MBLB2868]|uniref:hypothetical protein n=1 Tax=Pontibacter sp. MBLB2868 TaxID=3451555 RepID=UPI003F752189
MTMLWQHVRGFMLLAVIILLSSFAIPAAQANGNGNGSTTTTTVQPQSTQQSNATAVNAGDQKGTKPKAKVTTKPRNKSVLDAEVLDSPIAYFKNAFTAEEDDSEAAPNSGAVMITVKALIATLLSTIM